MGIRRSRWGVELVEECCFECKDGGDNLRACDYRNCLKAYHPHCTASREGDDFPPGEKFICQKFPDEDLLGDSDDNEQTFLSGPKSKPDKTNMSMKRKRSKKKRFVGWGTKELIEFLSFVGKDTKEPLDEAEVVGVVQEYIKQKRLFLGDKKKYFEGIKKSKEKYKIKDIDTDVILCVAGFYGDVNINMLSDENIQEAEFEEKVAAVHKDIVNHWIDRELKRLENRIDVANESGWHQQYPLQIDSDIMNWEKCKKGDRTACLADMTESSKGVAGYASESFEVLKEKPPEDATEQEVNAFNILNEETSKGSADQVADSLRVHEEESPEGVNKRMTHSYSLNINKESSEAGEAFPTGVTPDPVLHSPVAQDGSKFQAIDVDKDESNHAKGNQSSNITDEVINLDSTDEEEDHQSGCEMVHPPEGVNDGGLRTEQSESALGADMYAEEEARRGFHGESQAVRRVDKGLLHDTCLWHYADPRGNTQGPFILAKLQEWKRGGYFGEDFKVWRTGQTKEDAILLTDALKMYL
ncbi:hypothetical protein PR202_ga08827 [Eleusine coracana subsp. coracana]|uniref:GYF domain-containing protein n=1 Tax=Eleusine coracana subsp. coracana TaxID=191504 RepID=A0AAV5C361_ELECO|nr:hypothetical protein PR202_ga08827 [Eleusine coracana subsp. coracana]